MSRNVLGVSPEHYTICITLRYESKDAGSERRGEMPVVFDAISCLAVNGYNLEQGGHTGE